MKLEDFGSVSYLPTLSRFSMFLAFLHATGVVAGCKMPVALGRGMLKASCPLIPVPGSPCRAACPVSGYFNGISNSQHNLLS